MRVAAQVLIAYLLLVLTGAVWHSLPLGKAAPDVVALYAIYFGLTARYRLAPAMAGAIVLGYLADLLVGSPRGLLAFVAGAVCLAGHFVQGRLMVRGWMFTVLLSTFAGTFSGAVALTLRATVGMRNGELTGDLALLALTAVFTGIFGPLVFKLCRLVDAKLARTQRERDLALEGLIP